VDRLAPHRDNANDSPKTNFEREPEDKTMKGFEQFLLRGNVADMAVGIVIGAAFGTVVTGFVKDLLTPFIAALVKQPDFSALTFTINGGKFLYGEFINALVSFVIIAGAVYFFVVMPMITLIARMRSGHFLVVGSAGGSIQAPRAPI
jgi:large conductance mechanosensitive channel